MIETKDQFETAFERVLQYLGEPPAPGSSQDEEFRRLLDEISQYRDRLPPESEAHPAAAAFAELERHLADFQQRHPGRLHDGEYSGFGFGRDVRGEVPGA